MSQKKGERNKMAVRDVLLVSVVVLAVATVLFATFFISRSAIDTMVSIPVIAGDNTTVQVLEDTKNLTDRFDYVVFGVFIGLTLAILITSWFIPSNPIFTAIYFLVIVIGVVLAVPLSNVWEDMTTSAIFGTTIQSFPVANNLLSNMPIYIAIIGFLGIVIMFAKPRTAGGGGFGEY